MLKTKKRSLCLILVILLALVFVNIGGGFCVESNVRVVNAYGTTKTVANNVYTNGDVTTYLTGDIWNGSEIDSANFGKLKTLLETLGCNLSTNANDSSVLTSADIRTLVDTNLGSGDESNKKDIVVKLGGLEWMITYISRNNSGDLIATLWITDSGQYYANYASTNENKYYGYNSDTLAVGAMYLGENGGARFAVDEATGGVSVDEYWLFANPQSLYGSSVMRAVVLNNGGKYAETRNQADVDMPTWEKKSDSIFSPFTYGDLANFIEIPDNMTWQKNETDLDDLGSTSWSNLYKGASEESYKRWKDDKLWLPSWSETGTSGLWGLSNAQRANRTEAYSGTKTYGNIMEGTLTWLRTGVGKANGANSSAPNRNHLLSADGSGKFLAGGVQYGLPDTLYTAVRPALHFNLSDAMEAAGSDAIEIQEITYSTSEDGAIVTGHTNAIENVENIEIPSTITVGEGVNVETYPVVEIAANAFKNCEDLVSVTIPASVTSIGADAFAGCDNLTAVIIQAEVPPTLVAGAFDLSNQNLRIMVPAGKKALYIASDVWSSYSDMIFELPETGIAFDIILPGVVIGLILLATVIVWKKKEQF